MAFRQGTASAGVTSSVRTTNTEGADGLWATSLTNRLLAGRRFRLFPETVSIPRTWRRVADIDQEAARLAWPTGLVARYADWQEHAFGPANAAVLLLWDRPGPLPSGRPDWIDPSVPNLGGVPRAHVMLDRELIKPNSTGCATSRLT
jgi:hypothetical protein